MLEGPQRLTHLSDFLPFQYSTDALVGHDAIAWPGFDSLRWHPMTSASGSVTNCRPLRVAAGLEWRSRPVD